MVSLPLPLPPPPGTRRLEVRPGETWRPPPSPSGIARSKMSRERDDASATPRGGIDDLLASGPLRPRRQIRPDSSLDSGLLQPRLIVSDGRTPLSIMSFISHAPDLKHTRCWLGWVTHTTQFLRVRRPYWTALRQQSCLHPREYAAPKSTKIVVCIAIQHKPDQTSRLQHEPDTQASPSSAPHRFLHKHRQKSVSSDQVRSGQAGSGEVIVCRTPPTDAV